MKHYGIHSILSDKSRGEKDDAQDQDDYKQSKYNHEVPCSNLGLLSLSCYSGVYFHRQWILTGNLAIKRIPAKFIPKLLNANQKKNRMLICQYMKQSLADDPDMLSKINTGYETWVYGYDPETKFQSSQWKNPDSPRPKKGRQSRSQV